jgi:hypothetical protein
VILSALVLLLLLVFILQNDEPVQISFFALEGVLSVGVALLLAAIAGVCSWRSPAARGFCSCVGPPAAGDRGKG